jgi:putative DNA primase/helicase
MTSAADLAARLGLRRAGKGYAGTCPACSYANGLRVNTKAGTAVWWCASCGSGPDLTAAVLGHTAPATPRAATASPNKGARALALWRDALPAAGSIAERYLARRALALPDGDALRYLPDAPHPSGTRAPCMIALAVDAGGQGRAVHRTYLAPGGAGKAALDPPRATLGPIGGAVVRLCRWRPGLPLVIGEGIETALSAGVLTGAPAWAALSAGNMARVPLPDGCAEVWIAADHDAPGQRASWAAADAFQGQGRRVRVLTPDTAGADFNDILKARGSMEARHA